MINGSLLRQTWRAQRTRVAVIAVALAIWSSLMPVIYATFGRQMESLIQSGIIPEAFVRLLGSSVFGLDAAIALGVGHPMRDRAPGRLPGGLRRGRDRRRAAERAR